MKILHIITGLNTGGAEMMLYKLLSKMNRDHFSPYVISLLDEGTIGEKIKALDIPVYCLNLKSLTSLPQALLKLVTIVKEINADLIQGWMYHGNLAAQFVKILTLKSIPVLWNIRQSLYSLSYEKKTTALIIQLGAKFSFLPEEIIYNSQTATIHHEAIGYNTNKNTVIPNGFNTELFKPSLKDYWQFRQELNIDDDSILIGLIGRFHPMKDHENFFNAASILINKNNYQRIKFICCGKNVDWHNIELAEKIKELNLKDKTFLLGERQDIAKINSALDIATSSSSHNEGFPNVIGEAMSCEVPCVVTNVGDSGLIVGDTGKIVPPKDPEALAQAWQELIDLGQEKRKFLGKKARQRIVTHFSLNSVVNQYENLYTELINPQ